MTKDIWSVVEVHFGEAKYFLTFRNRPWRALAFVLWQRYWHGHSARLAWGNSEAQAKMVLAERAKQSVLDEGK